MKNTVIRARNDYDRMKPKTKKPLSRKQIEAATEVLLEAAKEQFMRCMDEHEDGFGQFLAECDIYPTEDGSGITISWWGKGDGFKAFKRSWDQIFDLSGPSCDEAEHFLEQHEQAVAKADKVLQQHRAALRLPAPDDVLEWHPVSEPVPERLHSSPLKHIPLLLAVPKLYETPYRGCFMGGLIQAFRLDGSPSDHGDIITHWMEMPPMPCPATTPGSKKKKT